MPSTFKVFIQRNLLKDILISLSLILSHFKTYTLISPTLYRLKASS